MFRWKNKNLKDVNPSKIKRNLPAYIVLGLAVVAMTFFGVCTPEGQRAVGPAGIAASVGSDDITSLDFRRAHITQSQQYQQQFQGNFDPVTMKLSERVLNDLIEQSILYQEALRNGIAASDEEVERVILEGQFFQDENGRFNPQQFQAYLRNQGFNERTFTEFLKKSLVQNKLRSFVTSTYTISHKAVELDYKLAETKLNVEFIKLDRQSTPVEVGDEEVKSFLAGEEGQKRIKDYYDANLSDYNQEKQVKARHILIGFEGARRASGDAAQRSKDDARELAEKVLAEAKSEKVAFADLAKRYTDEPGGQQKGGDLGFFKRETMVQEFSEVAFAMRKGEVSGVVESPFGFHIIKVEDIKEARSDNLEDVQGKIARRLLSQDKAPTVLNEKATEVLEAAKKGQQEVIRQLGLQWQETGEFALNSRSIPGGIGSAESLKTAIYQLENTGDAYPEAIEVGGAKYILRLKDRKEADMSQLTAEKKSELVDNQKFMQAFWLFNNLTSALRQKYEDEGKVYRNPEYIRYDELLRSS
ncbi:MAG: peptidylprolyl isomerase [Oligoflexus sp.]